MNEGEKGNYFFTKRNTKLNELEERLRKATVKEEERMNAEDRRDVITQRSKNMLR